MNALHPDIRASLKNLSEALGITSRYLSPSKFILNIPFCFETLTWQLSFSRPAASQCPDVLVPDQQFAPVLRSETVVAACLNAHDVQQRGLTQYVKELLTCYEEYQQHLLNQLASPGTALRFEVDTVFKAADVKTQALCMPTQAIFVVTLYNSSELQQLQALLASLGIRNADVQEMERDIRLKIVFPLSPAHPQPVPTRKLHIPTRLEDLTGWVELPPWPAGGMCILEYLQSVRETLEGCIRQASRRNSMRKDFFQELSKTKLGPPVELEQASHSTATFDIPSEECPLLLMIDLPAAFPHQKPRLTLQAGQHIPTKSIQEYEWDPNWTAAEMAKHVYGAVGGACVAPC